MYKSFDWKFKLKNYYILVKWKDTNLNRSKDILIKIQETISKKDKLLYTNNWQMELYVKIQKINSFPNKM